MKNKSNNPTPNLPPTIVAEVCINWPRGDALNPRPDQRVLCQRFEDLIEFNRARGYVLNDWKLSQVSIIPGTLTETIVATFTETQMPDLNVKAPS